MQPTRRARERGSPTKPARRPRASLSVDKLAQHFLIDDIIRTDDGHEEAYTWSPHEVRFVLWYYLTTHLSPEAIATAFNVTYGADSGDVPQMQDDNVQRIIETVKNRIEAIDADIADRGLGQWPRPIDVGWIPCDHKMPCATLAETLPGRPTSVMRSADLKTRGSGDIAVMATGLWEGSWEEILECPRKHKNAIPATTTPSYPPPTVGAFQRTPRPGLRRRQNAEVIVIGDSSSGSNVAAAVGGAKHGFHPKTGDPLKLFNTITAPRTSLWKTTANGPSTQRSTSARVASAKGASSSSNKENYSPTKNLRPTGRAQAGAAVEDDSNVDFTDPAMVPCAPGPTTFGSGRSSGSSSYQSANAWAAQTRSSGTNSSYASARSRKSAESAAFMGTTTSTTPAYRPATFARQPNPTAPGGRNVVQAIFECFGGWDAIGFVFQLLIRAISCYLTLDPFMDLDVEGIDNLSDVLVVKNLSLLMQFLCVCFVTRSAIGYATDSARSYIWQRWAVDVSPPEAPHLSATAYLMCTAVACGTICYFCPKWGRGATSLFEKIALRYAAREATRVEMLGSNETV